MSTKPDQNEAGESQDREVIDVIEVPPAKTKSPGTGVVEPDPTNDDEESIPEDSSNADIEVEGGVTSRDGEDVELAVETDEVEAVKDNSAEPDSEGEPVEGSESESQNETEPPSHFQCAVTGGTLKSVLSTIGAVVDETRIQIDEDGLRMRAVDPANVAMDDLKVDAAAFESYDATSGILAVDLDRFANIIKLAKADDLVQIALDHETRKLVIHVDGVEFTMACLAPDTLRTEPDTPDLELPAVVKVTQNALDRGMKAADMVSDHVSIQVDAANERFLVTAEGDTDEVSYEINDEDIEIESLADAEAWFSLDYMKKLVKSTPGSAEVTLRLGTDFPLVMAYDLADGNGHVTRLLAPRIRSD